MPPAFFHSYLHPRPVCTLTHSAPCVKLLDRARDQVERHDFVHAAHRNGFLWHAEDHSGVFILRNGVSATFVQQLHATGPVVTHTAQDDGEWVSASTIGGRSEQHIYRRLVPIDLFYGEGAGKLSEIDNKFFKLNIAAH